MGLMAAFVGAAAAPSSALRGAPAAAAATIGRPASSALLPRLGRRRVSAVAAPRRPPPRMAASEDFGEWKKKPQKGSGGGGGGGKSTTAEKAQDAAAAVGEAADKAVEDAEATVTELQAPAVETTVFSDWVDKFDNKLEAVKQRVTDVDTGEIKEESTAAAKSLVLNFISGDWLNRGELWGAVQVVFVYMMLKDPGNLDKVVSFIVGPVVLVAGALLSIKGAWDLGRKQISLWPAPVPNGTLKTKGIYGIIRHPLYAGVLLSSLGYASASVSAERFALTLGLAYILKKKIEVEENFLLDEYGDDYEDYQDEVPFKLIPKVY